MAHTQNRPYIDRTHQRTGGGGRGLECDKFSREAINKQFDNWFGAIYNHAPKDVVKRVLTRSAR